MLTPFDGLNDVIISMPRAMFDRPPGVDEAMSEIDRDSIDVDGICRGVFDGDTLNFVDDQRPYHVTSVTIGRHSEAVYCVRSIYAGNLYGTVFLTLTVF